MTLRQTTPLLALLAMRIICLRRCLRWMAEEIFDSVRLAHCLFEAVLHRFPRGQ